MNLIGVKFTSYWCTPNTGGLTSLIQISEHDPFQHSNRIPVGLSQETN